MQIQMIDIDRLEPHPQNPRREMRDLSDLVASVRRSGVLQCLTVVRHPEKPEMYRIVIGHRRHAAAKIAELKQLPCTVAELTEIEQLATMMAENVQRNDLTVPEQVGGIQLMTDLGESVGAIAKATGMSETAVKKRAKISKLGAAAVADFARQGATIEQLIKIASLEDPRNVERCLNSSSKNLEATIATVMREEKDSKGREEIEQKISGWARHIDNTSGLTIRYIRSLYGGGKWSESEVQPPEESGEYVYLRNGRVGVTIYRVVADGDLARKEIEAQEERARQARVRTEEGRVAGIAAQLREAWVRNFRGDGTKDARYGTLCAMLIDAMLHSAGVIWDKDVYCEMRGVKNMDSMPEDAEKDPARTMLCAAYARMMGTRPSVIMWDAQPKKDSNVHMCYRWLERLGYPVSDMERAWLDGTHPCWKGESE